MSAQHDSEANQLPENAEGGAVGIVGKSYFESLKHVQDDQFPTNPTGPLDLGKAIYPENSILEDWMRFVRQYAESAACYLIGSILPVIGAILGRNVWYSLDRKKYPNLYIMLAGKPGDRKTTAIKQAERLAERLLKPEQLSPSTMSPEALMDQYDPSTGGHPDQLLIADDANSVMANWTESQYGKGTGKKYLELYDCGQLNEAFRKNQQSGDSSQRIIPETSTSIIFGATFNICRFSKLEVRDGMSRRFLYYVAEKTGAFIPNPPQFNNTEFVDLCLQFEKLKEYQGQMRFSEEAMLQWIEFQRQIRDIRNNLPMDEANMEYCQILSEVPSLVIKIAMIFHICRHIKNATFPWDEICPKSLQLAIDHVNLSVEASKMLANISERARIKEEAESIYAQIQIQFEKCKTGDAIILSKSALTNAFAKNPGRYNALKPNRLYLQLLPYLMSEGKCKMFKCGRKTKFAFKLDED